MSRSSTSIGSCGWLGGRLSLAGGTRHGCSATSGGCIRTALGSRRTTSEAARWYRLAVDQGDVAGQYDLGVRAMYENGTGVPQDHIESARWYRLAADQGDAPSDYLSTASRSF